MKFVLVFSICSAITGFCNNPMVVDNKFNYWSDCVAAGGKLIMDFSNQMPEETNKDKLYISYFCNEKENIGSPT